MNITVYSQLIFLCLLNIIFFLSGVILNSLVLLTFWQSTQLRKKVCHCLIIVLSFCDLITVLLGIPAFFLRLTLLLTEKYNLLLTIEIYRRLGNFVVAMSMPVLFLMSIERYLGVYYPIFHRTSITRSRLLTALATISTFPATLIILSTNQMVISYSAGLGIFFLIYVAPFFFFNYKLLKIARKFRRRSRNVISSRRRKNIISLKNVSSCLLAVKCFVFLSIPTLLYIVVSAVEGSTSRNALLSALWGTTIYRMNCTFNCLIFFWKNKVLQIEGLKVLQAMR